MVFLWFFYGYQASCQVQEAAGDLAAFLKEAKAEGGDTDTALAPRARQGYVWDAAGTIGGFYAVFFHLFINRKMENFEDFEDEFMD